LIDLGSETKFLRIERPNIVLDEQGAVIALLVACPGGLFTRKAERRGAHLGVSCRPIWATPLITSRPSKLNQAKGKN
jgi:hypothetical protein